MPSYRFVSTLLLSGVTWGAAFGCGDAPSPSDEGAAGLSVQIYEARKAPVSRLYQAAGTLQARETAVLTSKVAGFVREVKVRSGDRVEQGQLLIVLEADELEARLRGARAALEESRQAAVEAESGLEAAEATARLGTTTYERFQELNEKRAVSRQEFDEVEERYTAALAGKKSAEAGRVRAHSALERAEADVAVAEAMWRYTQIVSPFPGRVIERHVDPGNLASPGGRLLVIEQRGPLRAEVSVDQSEVGSIAVGSFADLQLQGRAGPVRGRVGEVVPAVDPSSRAFLVKVDLPEEAEGLPLAPGMFVRAEFEVGETERMQISAAALFRRGELDMVWVIEEGRAQLRLVTVGSRRGDLIEVLSGLSDGERIVVQPDSTLQEGMRVTAANE
ncbi:MAG: efflux RND transporter periplasmic adaptor subunit [Vicinamibacteria bacterium]